MRKIIPLLLIAIALISCTSQKDEIFKKKQECETYKNKISEEAKKKGFESFNVQEIFYSEKYNSCLYTVRESLKWGIYDYLSNIEILELPSPAACNCKENEEIFYKELKNSR